MKRIITPLLLLLCTAFFACAQQRTATKTAATITVSNASAIFPMNDYLTTLTGTPYPAVKADVIKNINTSGFVNVMDYGAKGDGKTYDDAAIKKAFTAAKTGVVFPFGKTFLVKDVAHITLTHDLTVYATGAVIKMGDGQGYTWLSLDFKSTANSNKVIWIGGTFDGNQQNQYYPGNTNSKYDKAFTEDHGRFIGVRKANFAMFFAVTTINTVVDGPTFEDCKLGVFSNCTASGGAPIWYDKVQEQGTYYKVRATGALKAVAGLFLNLTCYGGSIATHYSYPTNQQSSDALNGTLSVHVNVKAWNQAQDAIHIEDCRNNFFYNVDIGSDGSTFTQQRIHLSNQSELVVVDHSTFSDGYVNFNEASHLKLGIVSNNKFTGSKVRTYIGGKPTISYNNTFADSKKGSNNTTSSSDAVKSGISIVDDKGKTLGKITAAGFVVGDTSGGGQGDSGSGGNHDTTHVKVVPGSFTLSLPIVLRWTKSKNAINYDVKRALSGGQFATIAPNVTDTIYTDNSAIAGTSYYYAITAKNADSSISSNIYNIGAGSVPLHDTVKIHDSIPVHDSILVPYPVFYPVYDTIRDTVYLPAIDTTPTTITPAQPLQVGMLPYQHADNLNLVMGRNRYVVSTGIGLQPMQRYSGSMQFSPSVVWEKKAFPSNLTDYETKLRKLADGVTAKKMPSIQLENEPCYNGGDVVTYLKMVAIAIKVFEPKGIEVYSGGLTFPALAAYCASLYGKDSKEFQVFKANGYAAANNETIAWITAYVAASPALHINFNFHVNIDENSLAVLPLVVAKIKQINKYGKIMCGECSFSKQSADWVTKALTILKPIDAVILYSEEATDGGDGLAVKFNADMDNAVKAFVKQQ